MPRKQSPAQRRTHASRSKRMAKWKDHTGKLAAYAWPGGYPLYYVTEGGDALCPKCADRSLLPSSGDDPVVAGDINYEDADLYCDDCNKRIESAYAEDDAPDDRVHRSE